MFTHSSMVMFKYQVEIPSDDEAGALFSFCLIFTLLEGCRNWGCQSYHWHPQFLADQLQIMPTDYYSNDSFIRPGRS